MNAFDESRAVISRKNATAWAEITLVCGRISRCYDADHHLGCDRRATQAYREMVRANARAVASGRSGR